MWYLVWQKPISYRRAVFLVYGQWSGRWGERCSGEPQNGVGTNNTNRRKCYDWHFIFDGRRCSACDRTDCTASRKSSIWWFLLGRGSLQERSYDCGGACCPCMRCCWDKHLRAAARLRQRFRTAKIRCDRCHCKTAAGRSKRDRRDFCSKKRHDKSFVFVLMQGQKIYHAHSRRGNFPVNQSKRRSWCLSGYFWKRNLWWSNLH